MCALPLRPLARRTGHALAAATLAAVALALLGHPARAQNSCLTVAGSSPPLVRAGFTPAALSALETRLTFVGHSTFLIESAAGVRIATDYTGNAGPGPLPDVVTMNHAHSSHYTEFPDPRIAHVLRGWNPGGGHAEHDLQVGDVHIRNVPTNIRSFGGTTEEFGNSIFIFEMKGLCIAHLGHLHHELTGQQLGQIGLVDVVLVPVDGSYTLDLDGMISVIREINARLIVPMHYFNAYSLERFLERMRPHFDIRIADQPQVTLTRPALPQKPQVLVLPGP
ncbi:MAG TPA: MBL fold metallo-hydrolase [Hyphomicrobiales bacterium]|nr:MBL fold metallo-hydrolase [Rhodobiaceae bacterium]HXK53733.1 MBL fold metallo-hydrolase [Hyphomicrobiales bacterium]